MSILSFYIVLYPNMLEYNIFMKYYDNMNNIENADSQNNVSDQ